MSKISRALLHLAVLPCTAGLLLAQTAVRAHPERQQWTIDAGKMTYAMGVNEQGTLQSLYYGPRLGANAVLPVAHSVPERASQGPPSETTPQEYPAWGAGNFTETALKVDSPNGDRTLILKYDSAIVKADTLEIVLKDAAQPLKVHLYYQAFPEGVIARWSRIENAGTGVFALEDAASAAVSLPDGTGYNHSWMTGMWAGEFQLHTEPLEVGKTVQESRTGHTSLNANPWFADRQDGGDDGRGRPGVVWGAGLERQLAHRDGDDVAAQARVVAGFNNFDFHWNLAGWAVAGDAEVLPRLYRWRQRRGVAHPEPFPAA